DDALLVHGKARPEGDGDEKVVRVRVDRVEKLEDVRARNACHLTVTVEPGLLTKEKMLRLKEILESNPGGCRTYLKVREENKWEAVIRVSEKKVRPADELLSSVDRLFGGRVTSVS
ncbi:MAG: hypothetical protein ACOCVR_03545, partial [Myxococcota bacterium]